MHTKGQISILAVCLKSIYLQEFDDILLWCHSSVVYLLLACTRGAKISRLLDIFSKGWQPIYFIRDLWTLRSRSLAVYIPQKVFSCKVGKYCCLQREDIHIPWRRGLLHSSKYQPIIRCIFCWRSSLVLHSKESHMQSLITSLICKYCLGQSRLFSILFSNQSKDSQA